MPNAASSFTHRTGLALLIALTMTGVALAAPNNGGGGGASSKEDCQQQAEINFAVAMASCGVYGGQPDKVGLCQSDAILAHFLALRACEGDAALHGGAGSLGVGGGLTVSDPDAGRKGLGGLTHFHGGLRAGNPGIPTAAGFTHDSTKPRGSLRLR